MFTTNAALNHHCKWKHNDVTEVDGNERTTNDDNGVVETQTSQGSAKRNNKRKIPKIVYVMPGKLESEPQEIQAKKTRVGNTEIEIQSITSIPIYIVDK